HVCRHAGKYCAAQNQRLSVAQTMAKTIKCAEDAGERRIEMFIDWRPDNEHEITALGKRPRILRYFERLLPQNSRQCFGSALFVERHFAVADLIDRLAINVEDDGLQPSIGEDERERQTDMPAAADDADVAGEVATQVLALQED